MLLNGNLMNWGLGASEG